MTVVSKSNCAGRPFKRWIRGVGGLRFSQITLHNKVLTGIVPGKALRLGGPLAGAANGAGRGGSGGDSIEDDSVQRRPRSRS